MFIFNDGVVIWQLKNLKNIFFCIFQTNFGNTKYFSIINFDFVIKK